MSHLKNKIVTVFGGSGFVGRHLVAALVREGAVVRIATRHKSSCYQLRAGALVGQVVPIVTDYGHLTSLRNAVKGADFVINTIGILHENKKGQFSDVHCTMAEKIAKACKKEKVEHFIHFSALGADAESDSNYLKSKGEGEAAVLKAFPNTVILRPSLIFGEGDGFFTRFAKMSRLLPALPLIGGGETQFQPVYVGDIVETCLTTFINHTFAKDIFHGRIIECAGPEVYSFKELIRYIQGQINKETMLVPMPFALAKFKAWFWEKLPGKILTVDQVRMLEYDNVESGQDLTLEDIGIIPTPLETIVPDYLQAYRTGGEFTSAHG